MIEKKFRIWDIETKQFIYYILTDIYPTGLTKEYVEESTEQYVGKDMNGNDMYQGDIYKDEGDFIYIIDSLENFYYEINETLYSDRNILIGNKHENPELLKEIDDEN